MSEQLSALRAMIVYLSPPHDLVQRGIGEQTPEKLYQLLLDLETHLDDLEDDLAHAEAKLEAAELEAAEAEQEQAERKPPL